VKVDRYRRHVLFGAVALLSSVTFRRVAAAAQNDSVELPAVVAGIRLPLTVTAKAAATITRRNSPGFLYNHCLRTYMFGALLAKERSIAFDEEAIFIASCLHDLGLVQQYQSTDEPFEVDSANAAREFLSKASVNQNQVDLICDAIAFHTSALASLRPPQVGLVGTGAGADVFGSGLRSLSRGQLSEVLATFPRLNFKVEFRKSLLGYCVRKPRAQIGTWTDAFCRAHVTNFHFPNIDERLTASPFSE
jgi:hypothetical protein